MSGQAKKKPSQTARSIRALMFLLVLAIGLAGLNAFTSKRDVATATGPADANQAAFFVAAADRPDIEPFFKGMTHDQRLAMTRNLSKHDDPRLAELIGKLLTTFDGGARLELGKALNRLAKENPEAIAKQLKLGSSFQRLAVYQALDIAGPAALPYVAAQIKEGGARANAANYLVEQKAISVPLLLPYLDDQDKDIRLAAAEALGKIRTPKALPGLQRLYSSTKDDEPLQYLAAIAAIGYPNSEAFLTAQAKNEGVPSPYRAQCLLGLGRIATTSAEQTLWTFVDSPDLVLAQSAISGLQLVGDRALSGQGSDLDRIRVAEGIDTPRADAVIRAGLESPRTQLMAAKAAAGRPSLAQSLLRKLSSEQVSDGQLADAIATALSTTAEGQNLLKSLQTDPRLEGLVKRRLSLN
jgi:HEAT repeat protein